MPWEVEFFTKAGPQKQTFSCRNLAKFFSARPEPELENGARYLAGTGHFRISGLFLLLLLKFKLMIICDTFDPL
jgi:hypothetical protein